MRSCFSVAIRFLILWMLVVSIGQLAVGRVPRDRHSAKNQDKEFVARMIRLEVPPASSGFASQVDQTELLTFAAEVKKKTLDKLSMVDNKCSLKIVVSLSPDKNPKFTIMRQGVVAVETLQAIQDELEKISVINSKTKEFNLSFVFQVRESQPANLKKLAGEIKKQLDADQQIRQATGNIGAEMVLVDELNQARRDGWRLANALIEQMPELNAEDFPGLVKLKVQLHSAIEDLDVDEAIDDWPEIDVDELTRNNPVFWAAFYETVPGNGYLEAVYASMLKGNGDLIRSLQVAVIARNGNAQSQMTRQAIRLSLLPNQRVIDAAMFRTNQGIKEFDQGNYDKATRFFKQLNEEWPQFGLAHYELGLTQFHQDEIAAGRKPPELGQLRLNPKTQIPSSEVYQKYAVARGHDPMIKIAYQGAGMKQDVLIMFRVVGPSYAKISNLGVPLDDRALEGFALGCQKVKVDDYALFARQITASRRTPIRFQPADFEFIKTSLKRLAPGARSDQTLKRLGGKQIKSYRFGDPVAPDL